MVPPNGPHSAYDRGYSPLRLVSCSELKMGRLRVGSKSNVGKKRHPIPFLACADHLCECPSIMPRAKRVTLGGYVCYVLHRANGRLKIFKKDGDLSAFEKILAEGTERFDMRICDYCIISEPLASPSLAPTGPEKMAFYIKRGSPLGEPLLAQETARRMGLESTMRDQEAAPKKAQDALNPLNALPAHHLWPSRGAMYGLTIFSSPPPATPARE